MDEWHIISKFTYFLAIYSTFTQFIQRTLEPGNEGSIGFFVDLKVAEIEKMVLISFENIQKLTFLFHAQ